MPLWRVTKWNGQTQDIRADEYRKVGQWDPHYVFLNRTGDSGNEVRIAAFPNQSVKKVQNTDEEPLPEEELYKALKVLNQER